MTTPIDRYCAYLEGLTPQSLDQLSAYVADDVRFLDPLNDVRGVDAMAAVFRHMFENLGEVRFSVDKRAADGDTHFLSWRFEASLRGRPWRFDGTSVITVGPDGRVTEHIDHWDASRQLYAHLPVIGWLLSWLRRRMTIR